MTAIRLRYSHSLDARQWSARYARGEVPDELPYGLHRLDGTGRSLHVEPPPSGLTKLASRAARFLTGRYEWAGRRGVAGASELNVAWDEGVGIPLALTARHAAVATGVIWLTDHVRRPRALLAAEREALQRCVAVWALSSAQLPILREVWGVDDRRLHHLRFGVDQEFWTPSREAAGPGRVLVVGNDRDRDHDTAIRAVEALKDRGSGARLHLVTNHQVSVPADTGVHTNALSHVALRDEYRSASVCVVAVKPNVHCSGVTATLEAMACGRPVVVTDTPGMRDYVTHGVNGLLVQPGDSQELASAIDRIESNPALGPDLGEAGRRTVEERFNTAAMAAELAGILNGA
ncbi:glycosyltransferase [Geodermatophilus sp. SYSU D00705]